MPSSEKIIFAAAVAIVAVIAVYTVYTLSAVPGTVTTPVPSSFTVNGNTYAFTYVATTQAEREAGLMNKKIANTTTMLFAFPSSGQWQFWMYNTNTSLDIIWVSATGESGSVVYLVTGAQPCYESSTCTVYSSTAPANYAIEAKAGFAAANDIHLGTAIQFKFGTAVQST